MQPEHIGRVGQVRLYVDTRQIAHVDMDDLDAAVAQRAKHLTFDPCLHRFPHRGRTAAAVEHRRQALGRVRVERAAEPACLGFEHRGLVRSPGKRHDASI
jgi:hypothetical protein